MNKKYKNKWNKNGQENMLNKLYRPVQKEKKNEAW